MAEGRYQRHVILELRKRFTGCVILKNDPTYVQGIPDLTILYMSRWALLEVKVSIDAPVQPNQEYYVSMLNDMSYAAFICPENEEDVFRELEQAFKSRRKTRIPKRQ